MINIDKIKKEGFKGFKTIEELRNDNFIIPSEKGVYYILSLKEKPKFLSIGSGGYFKGKNPNVDIETLEANWVDKTMIIYIGKATSLKKRLNQYIKFGEGKNIGHYGGRYIWQLTNSKDLLVCWKTSHDDPRVEEKKLIEEFVSIHGKRPFANLVN
ncbi:MAG TPA: hypothetical protein VKZ97_06985 [Flavobacteriaceae bacterium]|nr:hypothetical protein [Flavobacteriaceae bacterium]